MPKRKTSHPGQDVRRPRKLARNPRTPTAFSEQSFEYDVLDFTAGSIHFLEILPGADDSIIRCSMRNMKILKADYCCLSYTWQPTNPNHDIETNRMHVEVGENLYQFLHAARAGRTILLFWDDSSSSLRQRPTTCMYLPIRDAGDIHLFEYAIDDTAPEVVVNYARAYKYLKGQPRMYGELFSDNKDGYIWIDKPSEEVHYLFGPNANPPALRTWTSPTHIEISQPDPHEPMFNSSIGSSAKNSLDPTRLHKPRLEPARRYWDREVAWSRMTFDISSMKFAATESGLREELRLQTDAHDERRSGFKLSPQVARSTILLLKHPKDASSPSSEASISP